MNKVGVILVLAMVCSLAAAQANGDVRLIGKNSLVSGRLEIYLNGQWGSICYNNIIKPIDNGAAQAACRQLGFSDYLSVDTVANMGISPGTGPIHLSDVSCGYNSYLNNANGHILRCSFDQPADSSCQHSMDMAVTCTSSSVSPYDGAVRLVDGGTRFLSSGVAEVYLHDQWGTMCSYEVSVSEASTICRQLGYTSSTTYSSILRSTPRVWLDDINCDYSEPCLDICFTYPTATYTPTCSLVAVVNCTFDIAEKDSYSAGSESVCAGYLYLVNHLEAIIIGVVVALIIAFLLFVMLPIIICCCCIPGCILHSCRERRVVYQVIQ